MAKGVNVNGLSSPSVGREVDDQEQGGEEAQQGAPGGHHGNDTHAAARLDHRAQRRRHQDLADVHLVGDPTA